MVAKGVRRGQGGLDCEFGVSRCKQLHIEWMDSNVLLHRELDSMSWDKLEWKRMWKRRHVYVQLSHFTWCTAEINSALEIKYTSIKNKKHLPPQKSTKTR